MFLLIYGKVFISLNFIVMWLTGGIERLLRDVIRGRFDGNKLAPQMKQ